MSMSPQEIEEQRKLLKEVLPPSVANGLCELALDGLKFRGWVDGASRCPSIVATALAHCTKPEQYRKVLEDLLASGKIRA